MPSANKTPNYNLTQYSNNGSDKISALQDYNADMSKIDTALNNNANNIATNATNITTKADAATTYSKIDVDSKLDTKADKSAVVDVKKTADNALPSAELPTILKNRYPYQWHGTALAFGDSIAAGADATDQHGYASITTETLGMTLHNYAVGGATFMTSVDNNIPKQASTAIADTSYDHDSVTLITISGGINDSYNLDNTSYGAAAGLRAMITTLMVAYPNAKVVVLIGLSGGMIHNTPIGDMQGQIRNFMAQLSVSPALKATFIDASLWLVGNDKYANTASAEHIHPNDAGHQIIAGNLINLLLTGTSQGVRVQPYGLRLAAGDNTLASDNPYVFKMYDNSLTVTSNLYLYTTQDLVVINGYLNFVIADTLTESYVNAYVTQGGLTSYMHVASIPAGLCPRLTAPVPQQAKVKTWKTGVPNYVLGDRRLTAFTRAQIDISKAYGGVIEATMIINNDGLSSSDAGMTLGAGGEYNLAVSMYWPLAVPNTDIPNI